VTQNIVAGLTQLFPAFRRLKVMRQWGGICDVCWDYSPIIGPSPVENLFLNCGWGTGGFKATPVGGYMLAWLMATGRHHELSQPFDLSRFTAGRMIDEVAGAGIAH
jgi:sarcosine oxidase subunit beta